MTSNTKNAEELTAKATMKEARARDAALAMREYQAEQLAIQARTERLREQRLARDRQTSKDVQQRSETTRRKATMRAATKERTSDAGSGS
jgi:hypothetical protein